jgi:hypothetical protein
MTNQHPGCTRAEMIVGRLFHGASARPALRPVHGAATKTSDDESEDTPRIAADQHA